MAEIESRKGATSGSDADEAFRRAIEEWDAVQALCERLLQAGGHADKESKLRPGLPKGEWLL